MKYRSFAILAAMLLLAGFSSGWGIGGNQLVRLGELISQPVRLLLSGAMIMTIAALPWVNVSAEPSSNHTDHASNTHSLAPAVQ